MKKIIEKYKKFIFIYVLINLIAFFVNAINIRFFTEFNVSNEKSNSYTTGVINYLTYDGSWNNPSAEVWRFVKFVEQI